VIANAFFCLGGFGVFIAVLCVIGALIIYFTQGEQAALFFIETSIVKFNGILVGATGYGLLAFVHSSGKRMLGVLLSIVSTPDDYAAKLAVRVRRVT
jgi:Na+/proline symporter